MTAQHTDRPPAPHQPGACAAFAGLIRWWKAAAHAANISADKQLHRPGSLVLCSTTLVTPAVLLSTTRYAS